MQNNKWNFVGVISQVHDLDAKRLVFETHEIQDKTVVRHVVEMHNEGKSLREIDTYLLDEGKCTQEEREFIVEEIFKYFDSEYEFRAVVPEGDGVQSMPLDQANVGEVHDVVSIGLYRNKNDGMQEHILDLSEDDLIKMKNIFKGYPYKKD